MYLCDQNPHMTKLYILFFLLVVAFSPTSAQIISTYAGSGVAGHSGDGGPATAARMDYPTLAIDRADNIYVAEYTTNYIRKISPSGIITSIAGNGTLGYSGDGGPATNAQLSRPNAIATDAIGNLYIAEDYRVRKVDTFGIISTVAGNGTLTYTGDGAQATASGMQPSNVAVDGAGVIYISMRVGERILKVNTSGIVTTVAGDGIGGITATGVPATSTHVFSDWLGIDPLGNIYSAGFDPIVYKISAAGIITVFAGTTTSGYSGDGGPATSAQLNIYPMPSLVDGSGNVYLGDERNHRIRVVNSSGTISTLAGTGVLGYSGDGGLPTLAQLNTPGDIVQDAAGNFYIADQLNYCVRKISFDHSAPFFTGGASQPLSICAGSLTTPINSLLSATDADAGHTQIWSLITAPAHGTCVVAYSAAATGGIITPTGTSYTPFPGYSGPDFFQVRVSGPVYSDTISINVTITPPPDAGSISGANTVCTGAFTTLSDLSFGGTWRVSNTLLATIDPVVGIITGVAAGADTALYIVTCTGGSIKDTAKFPLTVVEGGDCDLDANALAHQMPTITVSPNPNTGAFTLFIHTATREEKKVIITNLLGKVVAEFAADVNTPQNINLDLADGVYFLSVKGLQNRNMTKFVIVR